ncbi:hypothetical protein ACFYNW_28415 [Streptomyces virginiae]|uniref:hypothetical protein n=1 Tax=Streptomyces virginiae TaxID=1961 RepID=UPI0036DFB993
MAENELTPQETAVWDQLRAELEGGRARADRRMWWAACRQLLMAVLLPAALIMLVAGSFAGSEPLAWSGVIAWVGAVLIVSHHHGHGPRLPMRRQPGAAGYPYPCRQEPAARPGPAGTGDDPRPA